MSEEEDFHEGSAHCFTILSKNTVSLNLNFRVVWNLWYHDSSYILGTEV
jgi:hypothetical protein